MPDRESRSSWNPSLYLEFGGERTQPCLDLVQRIQIEPRRIVDLGCGPGNSTAVLRARWPEAQVTAVDGSAEMLEQARVNDAAVEWVEGDISVWRPVEAPDLIFTNAALQWVGNHEELLPGLLSRVARGGALAAQIPHHLDTPAHRTIERLCTSSLWAEWLDPPPRPFEILDADDYYRMLAPLARQLDIWETTYWHILENPAAIVQWMTGTGLRPYVERLPEERREDFREAYAEAIELAYPAQPDGRALFPFPRLFIIARAGM